jgi:hypothetical protein
LSTPRLISQLLRIASNTALAYAWAGAVLFGVLVVSERVDPQSLGDLTVSGSWLYVMSWLVVGVLFVVVAMAALDLLFAVSPWPRRTAIAAALVPGALLAAASAAEPSAAPVALFLVLTGLGFGATARLPGARAVGTEPYQVGSTRSLPHR